MSEVTWTAPTSIELAWIEFKPRPKKDGLHDSGYRFIALTGVDKDGNRHQMGEWHDHLIVEPKCNIEVLVKRNPPAELNPRGSFTQSQPQKGYDRRYGYLVR